MSKRTAFKLVVFLLGSLALCATISAQTAKPVHKAKTKQPAGPPPLEVQELDVPAEPPPPPPTPEQLPAGPVVITYQKGLLTIDAHNSALADILRVVSQTTGAAVEVPEDANERVFGQIGPGAVRDVLASLLNGTKFNYVMLGTAENPNALARVDLTPKPAGNTNERGPVQQAARSVPPPVQAAPVQPAPAPPIAVAQPVQTQPEPAAEVPAVAKETPQNEALEPAVAQDIPIEPPAAQTSDSGSTPTAGKSTSQMLQDLYARRRQMMEQEHQRAQQQPPRP